MSPTCLQLLPCSVSEVIILRLHSIMRVALSPKALDMAEDDDMLHTDGGIGVAPESMSLPNSGTLWRVCRPM